MAPLGVRLHPGVTSLWPEAEIRLVWVHGLDNRGAWDAISRAIEDLERRLKVGEWAPAGEDAAEIRVWHDAYRRFGTNPRKFRPSLDALSRRIARTGSFPRINPAVDAYNLISVTHRIPAGAFDLQQVAGDIAIRLSHPADRFTPLGEPNTVETPHPGEVVYADGQRVLTRHWNHRDADATKLTESTRSALFCLDRVEAWAVSEERMAAAAAALAALLAPGAEQVLTGTLDRAHPDA